VDSYKLLEIVPKQALQTWAEIFVVPMEKGFLMMEGERSHILFLTNVQMDSSAETHKKNSPGCGLKIKPETVALVGLFVISRNLVLF